MVDRSHTAFVAICVLLQLSSSSLLCHANDFGPADLGNVAQACDQQSFIGCHTWNLVDMARHTEKHPEVIACLDAMKEARWVVYRTQGLSLGATQNLSMGDQNVEDSLLQIAPGLYNEEVWAALDFVLDAAAVRNLRFLFPIEDYLLSIDRFIQWSSNATSKIDFFSDPTIIQLYKDHLETYVMRVNSFNNRTYRDDPTIYAWNVLNKPSSVEAPKAWRDNIGSFMSTIDANHDTVIGNDRFFDRNCSGIRSDTASRHLLAQGGTCKAAGYASSGQVGSYDGKTPFSATNLPIDDGVQIINADGSKGKDISETSDGKNVHGGIGDYHVLDAGLSGTPITWWADFEAGGTNFESCKLSYNDQVEIEGEVGEGSTEFVAFGSSVESFCTVEFDC